MKWLLQRISILLKRLILILMIYQLCRFAFLVANYDYFESTTASSLLLAFLVGLRFDLSAILMVNLLFVLLHLIPLKIFFNLKWQQFLKILFFITNIPLILLNCIDLEYFKYQGKRTTADLFHLFGMGDDMKNTIPQMAMDFWYVIVVFVALTILLMVLYNRIKTGSPPKNNSNPILNWVIILPVMALFFLGARGGLQLKPLGIMAAARFTSPQLVPLVLNTPFTVIRTLGKSITEEKKYMSDHEALKYFNKDHQYNAIKPFTPLNVVIILLESFSSEYISAFNNGDGYTPFLDSLMREGMTYSNAYANAKKSIDGIPAIIASMPSLLPVSYISSPYNSNKLESIAAILQKKGYSSAFFHGGNNGTMNFDNFTMITGFEKYYGRNEYPGDHYDGHWGVYDENFYYFFIDKCNAMQQPFVNAFFSLSSHHPYSIPEHLKGKFKEGPLPIHESIGYADYALQQFFFKAKTTSWFNNTLFVITADHTGPSAKSTYNTKAGMFKIPIVFYHPGGQLKGWSERVTQQTDIVPGILDYLHFDLPFTAFGNSMFDTVQPPFAINYPGDVYQVIGDSYMVQFDGNDVIGAYAYKTDSLLNKNVADENNIEQIRLVKNFKSYFQQFNNALIKNELTPRKEKR